MENSALKISRVSKHFGGVKALTDINLEFGKGEIIGLIGSNGAGKSTLLNIIWGAFPPTEGQVLINGQEVKKITPEKAHKLGISIIFQHRCLMPFMTVAENIFIDNMPKKSGIIDYKSMHEDARKLLKMLELDIDSKSLVSELTAEEKQLVEIAKACSRNPKILLMDEPTTALRQQEVETLFGIMRNLKEQGCSVVFISHRLKEVLDVCDRISIIRDGRNIIEGPRSDFTADNIVDYMSGIKEKSVQMQNESEHLDSSRKVQTTKVLLHAKQLCMENVNNVSFKLHKGEILGFAGLGGCGIDDVFERLFGLKKSEQGELIVDGKHVKLKNPVHAIKSGIGLVPEDRQLCGEFLGMSVRDNICITSAQKRPYFSAIRQKAERVAARDYIEKLSVKTESDQTLIKNLSGGNQQKAIIAKWLDVDSSIILMSEPTAGIDVHAKSEVNRFIMKIASEGKGIVYTSSYITELMEVADRIIVLYKGEIYKEFLRSDFDHNKIYLAMNGIADQIEGAES